MEGVLARIKRYKYLLLMLAAGLVLILLPTGRGEAVEAGSLATEREARLEEVLSGVEGVGRTAVLCSEEGVVVVCDGADSSVVRLRVVSAVSGYTGLGSDRIEVLKMQTSKETEN